MTTLWRWLKYGHSIDWNCIKAIYDPCKLSFHVDQHSGHSAQNHKCTGPVFDSCWLGPYRESRPIQQTAALDLLLAVVEERVSVVLSLRNFFAAGDLQWRGMLVWSLVRRHKPTLLQVFNNIPTLFGVCRLDKNYLWLFFFQRLSVPGRARLLRMGRRLHLLFSEPTLPARALPVIVLVNIPRQWW